VPGSVGSFSWSGIWGTYFWVDPAEQLVAVQLIQGAPGGGGLFSRAFRDLTYGAFRVPDQDVPTSAAAPVTIDAATLAAYAGTYRFPSISSRDQQDGEARGGVHGFGGVGIDLTVEDGRVKVVSPVANAPAARAGIMANDIITHLDGEALQGLSVNQAVEKLRGPVNTAVRLKIVRKGQDNPIEVSIVRALIRVAGTGADLQVAVTRTVSYRSRGADRCRSWILRRVHPSPSSLCRAMSSLSTAATIRAWPLCATQPARRCDLCSILDLGKSWVSGSTDGRRERRREGQPWILCHEHRRSKTALRNCTGDEGGPFGFGDQVADPNPPRSAISAVAANPPEAPGRVRLPFAYRTRLPRQRGSPALKATQSKRIGSPFDHLVGASEECRSHHEANEKGSIG